VGKGATMLLVDGVEVDLHRLLVWGPLGVRLPAGDLWRNGRTFSIGNHLLGALGLEETLLHACSHLVVAGWRRGLSLRDVAQLLIRPDLDTERVCGLARRWGIESVLATGLLLASTELGLRVEVPVLDWAAGYPTTWRDQLWLRVGRPDQPVAAVESAAVLVELPGPAERRMLLRATLRPAPGTWRTPSQRVGRLAQRAARVARRAPAIAPER
jgi:hypothetical protein